MTLTIWPVFCVVAGAYGAYCIYYGIRYGLVEKRMVQNYWRQTEYTGDAAVRQGWTYIVIGISALLIVLLGLLKFGT